MASAGIETGVIETEGAGATFVCVVDAVGSVAGGVEITGVVLVPAELAAIVA